MIGAGTQPPAWGGSAIHQNGSRRGPQPVGWTRAPGSSPPYTASAATRGSA
jgi:hypothetical protein